MLKRKPLKERLAEIHNLSVLMSAEELFEEKGYEGTTMDEIAYVTGISKTTIYACFKSKEFIKDSLACKYLEKMRDIAKETLAGNKCFEEKFFDFCFAIEELFTVHPFSCNATLGNFPIDDDQQLYRRLKAAMLDILAEIERFLEGGKQDGRVSNDLDLSAAAIMLWSSITGVISMCINKEGSINFDSRNYTKKAFTMLLTSVR